jgi:flagellar L-ring protein precursor FlgH
MKKISVLFLILAAAGSAMADSLWPRPEPAEGPQAAAVSMFADQKAHKVGDLVTVLVVETTQASQKATTDYSKDFKHSNEAGIGPLLRLLPELGFNSSQAGQASGQTTVSSNFVAKLTTTVTEVLPSGNLRIEGKREIVTNAEKQEVTLTATVRPQDIGSDNTVASTYLADVSIKSAGKGPVADRQREGFFSRLLKWIF